MNIAAIHVDPQKGFTELCPDELPVAGGLEIVHPLNEIFNFVSFNIVSQDWHPEGAVHEATKDQPMGTEVVGYANVDLKWNKHCIAETTGSELITGINDISNYDLVVRKGIEHDCHPYGALWHDYAKTKSTGIIEFLHSKNINTVFVGGLALDFCVRETVLELLAENFNVVVIRNATKAVFPDNASTIFDELQLKGAILADCPTQAILMIKSE